MHFRCSASCSEDIGEPKPPAFYPDLQREELTTDVPKKKGVGGGGRSGEAKSEKSTLIWVAKATFDRINCIATITEAKQQIEMVLTIELPPTLRTLNVQDAGHVSIMEAGSFPERYDNDVLARVGDVILKPAMVSPPTMSPSAGAT